MEEHKEAWKKILKDAYQPSTRKMKIDTDSFTEQFKNFMQNPNKAEFIDWKDDDFAGGWTMFYCAVSHQRLDIAELLLDYGADINITNKFANTALMLASSRGHTKIVKLLLEKGANHAIADKDEWTALIHASCNGHTDIVKLLLDNGADFDTANKLGRTSLMLAIPFYIEIAKLLLEKGADSNIAEDLCGQTALMMAARSGRIEVVKLLLENGADHTTPDMTGKTALHWACELSRSWSREESHEAVVQLLLSRGANANAKANDGETPLQIACKRNQTEIVWLLVHQNCWLFVDYLFAHHHRGQKRGRDGESSDLAAATE